MQPKEGIIYQGPSLIDGNPIVVIATYRGGNAKTGAMVQTWILRADMDPRVASQTGADHAICGTCPHRGVALDTTPDDYTTVSKKNAKGREYTSVPMARNRSCYVNIGQGVLGVFKAFQRGRYHRADAVELGRDRMVRLGTYGDPAAVPSAVWDMLLSSAKGWTGYTHQSGISSADVRTDLTMISADNLQDAEQAWSAGKRTFRVVSDVSEIDPAREILCPASEEAGRRTTCTKCGLCAGTSSTSPKSIAIPAHGSGKGNFIARVAA